MLHLYQKGFDTWWRRVFAENRYQRFKIGGFDKYPHAHTSLIFSCSKMWGDTKAQKTSKECINLSKKHFYRFFEKFLIFWPSVHPSE